MVKYTVKLIDRKEIAEGTMAFYFEKPSEFEFKAGQYIEVTLINPPETDSEGNSRAFSIASAPYENNLMVATRMRDTAFKRVLKNVNLGTEVEIDGPYGSFTLQNDTSKPAVFLIGGIGITPVRSIILDATKKNLPHKIYLFYSNRRPEDSAFLEELTDLKKENPNYKLIATMTQMENSTKKWEGETGYINRAMIEKYVPNPHSAIYYIAGPQVMVSAMIKLLEEMDINSDNIKTEEFAGY
jgi:ferredoxin-NADP reductase